MSGKHRREDAEFLLGPRPESSNPAPWTRLGFTAGCDQDPPFQYRTQPPLPHLPRPHPPPHQIIPHGCRKMEETVEQFPPFKPFPRHSSTGGAPGSISIF